MKDFSDGFDTDGLDIISDIETHSFVLPPTAKNVVSTLPGITSRHVVIGEGCFRYIPPRID